MGVVVSKRQKRVRVTVLLYLVLTGSSTAQMPTSEVIQSCLQARAVSRMVRLAPMPTGAIQSEDGYAAGYKATYAFPFQGHVTGYAERGDAHALIVGGELQPLAEAQPFDGTASSPSTFNPYLADWIWLSAQNHHYLCVSFNFDGLGRSGAFQSTRGAYLMAVSGGKAVKPLVYARGLVEGTR